MTSLRGIVPLSGFLFIPPAILGVTGIWMTVLCSNTLTAVVSLCMIKSTKTGCKGESRMESRESMTIGRAVVNKAINYIFDHIEDNITVDDVARHCAYSKYHLTRIFKEETGEALYQFIKRLILEDFIVIYERKKGNYHNLPKEWCTFIEKYQHLATKDTIYIECTIDDPSITDENYTWMTASV